MGNYTQLKWNTILSEDAPLDILDDLCNGDLESKLFIDKFGVEPGMYSVHDCPNLPIDHIFGKSHRWPQIFFKAIFCKETRELNIDCEIKAYDSIYEHLYDWLKPFIVTGSIKEQGEWMEENDWITIYPE